MTKNHREQGLDYREGEGPSKVCGWFGLSGFLGSGRASMLPLGTQFLGL